MTKKERKKKEKKRADDDGEAKNITTDARNSTAAELDEPKISERKIYRRGRTRKPRKLNDGGKLEIVQVNAHNSSDYENPSGPLRPGV